MKNIRYFIQIVVFTAIWFFVGNDISAQNEYNFILLDDGIALNFNNNPMSVEKRNHTKLSSSICDNDGNLMFYCNASAMDNYYAYFTIYDKNDKVVYKKKIVYGYINSCYVISSPYETNTCYFFVAHSTLLDNGPFGNQFFIVKIKYDNGEYEINTKEFDYLFSTFIPYIYNNNIYIIFLKNGCVDIYDFNNTNLELVGSYNNSVLKLYHLNLWPCIKFNNDLSKLFFLNNDLLYIFDYDVKKQLITECKTYKLDYCTGFDFSKDYNYIYFSNASFYDFSIERCRVSDLISNNYNIETIWSQKINSDYADFLLCKDGNIYVLFARGYQKEKMRVIKDTESLHPTVEILDVTSESDLFPNIIRSYSSFVHNVSCNNVDFEYVGYPAKSLKWNFGDNTTTSNLKEVSHTYDKSGKYNVSLEAILHDNTKKSFSKEIEVNKLKNLMIQRD